MWLGDEDSIHFNLIKFHFWGTLKTFWQRIPMTMGLFSYILFMSRRILIIKFGKGKDFVGIEMKRKGKEEPISNQSKTQLIQNKSNRALSILLQK